MTSKLPRENITGVMGSQVDILNPRDSFPYRASVLRTIPDSSTIDSAITVPAGTPWLVHIDCSVDTVHYDIYKAPTFSGGTNVPAYHCDTSKTSLPTNSFLKEITPSPDGTKVFSGFGSFTVLLEGGTKYLVRLTNTLAADVTLITDIMVRT